MRISIPTSANASATLHVAVCAVVVVLSAPRHARAVLPVAIIAVVLAARATIASTSGAAARMALASMPQLGHAALAARAAKPAIAANAQALARLCNFGIVHFNTKKQQHFFTLSVCFEK